MLVAASPDLLARIDAGMGSRFRPRLRHPGHTRRDRCMGEQALILSPGNRKVRSSVPPELYRVRNLVERFFNKLKQLRRVAIRFERMA